MKENEPDSRPHAPITRREAMKRIALKGAVLASASVTVSHLIAFAADDEEIVRYNSLADPGEKVPVYSDYASMYSSRYASQSYYDAYASYAGYSGSEGYRSREYSSMYNYPSSGGYSSAYQGYSSSYMSSYNSYFRYMSSYMSTFTGSGRYNNNIYTSRYNFHANMLG